MSERISNSKTNSKVKKIEVQTTINDLRKLYYNKGELSTQQWLAMKNFDRYRITQLNSQTSDAAYHQKYKQLQVMANLSPYDEFLKEEYFL